MKKTVKYLVEKKACHSCTVSSNAIRPTSMDFEPEHLFASSKTNGMIMMDGEFSLMSKRNKGFAAIISSLKLGETTATTTRSEPLLGKLNPPNQSRSI